jgi:hypothetical protein
MSRAFTRALVISTISGLAIAPAIALAADTGSNAPATTVTTLTLPKSAQTGHSLTLTARVTPSAAAADADETEQSAFKDKKGHKGKRGGTTGKKGKGRGNGKKHGKRHSAETGSVTFVIDGKTLKPVPLVRGRADERIDLPPGNHTAAASYGATAITTAASRHRSASR